MSKKKAKLIYKQNSFDIIEQGDYVLCAVSGKEINLNDLNYWNVDLQEAYFSPIEANERYQSLKENNLFPPVMCPYPSIRIFLIISSKTMFNFSVSVDLFAPDGFIGL